MDIKKPMQLLLIEDDLEECISYKSAVKNLSSNIYFVAMTSSSVEGLKLVKKHKPEGIILDLELHNGMGSGLAFLSSIKKAPFDFKPIIIVITKCPSSLTHDTARSNGADFVFFKKQIDYSPKMVIETMLDLRPELYRSINKKPLMESLTKESEEEFNVRISDKINAELDAIGINNHLKGRSYIFDSIFFLLKNKKDNGENLPVFSQVASNCKKSNSSIGRAIQTAINAAWSTSSTEDLMIHYTARINYHSGVPSPTEFVYYYAEKIRKTI